MKQIMPTDDDVDDISMVKDPTEYFNFVVDARWRENTLVLTTQLSQMYSAQEEACKCPKEPSLMVPETWAEGTIFVRSFPLVAYIHFSLIMLIPFRD